MKAYQDFEKEFVYDSATVAVTLAKVGQTMDGVTFCEDIFERIAALQPCLHYDKNKKELQWVGLLYGYKRKE